jgi:hypothetical protein
MQLDPARPELDAPRRLRDRPIVGVDAAERDQATPRPGGLVQDQVVRLPVAVRLVHREDDPTGIERSEDVDQLLTRQPGPVGIIGPDVGVGVEQRCARKVREQRIEPGLKQ